MPDLLSTVAIIVVSYGSSDLLEQNLLPVVDSTPEAYVVVIDNFTTSEERAKVRALADLHGWTAVLSDVNEGFGIGMNRGVDQALSLGATSFLLLNPDATIDRSSLEELAQGVARSPLELLSPTVVRPDGSVWFAGSDLYLVDGRIRGARRRSPEHGDRYRPWLSGACLMVSRELWALVGGFRSDYFLYWEDVDLSWRIQKVGGTIAVHPSAQAVHAEGGTQKKASSHVGQAKSTTYYYYNIRNRLIFASLYLDDVDLRAWLRVACAVSWEILMQGGRRQLIHSPKPLLAAARGFRHGRRIARAELKRRSASGS
ncbi:glycosyltransferase family 2 protein [Glaciihabitans sp. UYNi722]|uniref:glycosyltransferase family 2 protein n=1 Tax=Glaciihabitans sp. UYNi722 TaxID=3156344 RepID=UPI00339A8071